MRLPGPQGLVRGPRAPTFVTFGHIQALRSRAGPPQASGVRFDGVFGSQNGTILDAKATENLENSEETENVNSANTPLFCLVFQGRQVPKPFQNIDLKGCKFHLDFGIALWHRF